MPLLATPTVRPRTPGPRASRPAARLGHGPIPARYGERGAPPSPHRCRAAWGPRLATEPGAPPQRATGPALRLAASPYPRPAPTPRPATRPPLPAPRDAPGV